MRNTSRYPIIRILLLVSLLAPAQLAGQAQTNPQSSAWQTYKSDAGNFSASFPGEPKDVDTSGPNGPPTHTIQVFAGTNGYMVVYVTSPSDQTVDDANFNSYRDSFIKSMDGCAIANEAAAAPAVRNFVGRFYHLNCIFQNTKLTLAGNLYWGKHYAYAVLAVFEPAATDPPAAGTFLSSFAINDAKK